MLTRAHRRGGFTLAEVLVSFALIAVLAAVIVPTIRGRLQGGYEDALVQEIDNLSSAVIAYRQDVGHYPPNFDYLTALPATPKDKCGVTLSATAQANWRGPYITRAILPFGVFLVAQKDSVVDTLYTATSPTGLIIRIKGPDTLTAHNIDVVFDGVNNKGTGSLQWTPGTNDVVMDYIIPTKSGAC
jgi:prepilin-type N-terminal cleavage/methylation domain-containing protein